MGSSLSLWTQKRLVSNLYLMSHAQLAF
uniref:Uncharacterized protein n=1 Tax=Rhizophora mucronata TaxID=61149 RepID=A0A2P2J9P7_RHIMU